MCDIIKAIVVANYCDKIDEICENNELASPERVMLLRQQRNGE